MGCGAICGDPIAESVGPTSLALRAMHILIPSLNKNSVLATKKTYDTFAQKYKQDAKRFHLVPKPQLTNDESVPADVMTKWKLVLFGQGSDNKSYCNCLGLPQANENQSSEILAVQSAVQSTVLYHDCFKQIELDLDRTFVLSEGRRRDFQNVLKRIANYFPKMGYTQGINFVVAFLIIIGYSENDAFWIFAHLALNRRYLLLGLYEDGFPLCNTFVSVFKSILKRLNGQLYLHLFQELLVDVSMWVFKWFITCFIYSFPIQMVKYAWEVIVHLGGLGIVALAISLTLQLGPHLLQKLDLCELSQFLKQLEKVETFNRYINMETVSKRAYELEIVPSDFNQCEGFYGNYFRQNCAYFQQHLRSNTDGLPKFQSAKSQSQQLLSQWYENILMERVNFQQNRRTFASNSFPLLLESVEKPTKRRPSEEFELILFSKQQEETAPDGKNKEGNPYNRSDRDFYKNRQPYPIDRINENIDQQSKSAISRHSNICNSRKSRKSRAANSKTNSIIDNHELEELDKLEIQVYNRSKQGVKINNFAAPSQSHAQEPTRKIRGAGPANNIVKEPTLQKGHLALRPSNTFSITAQNVLVTDSYDAISVSSRNASNKSRTKNNQASEPKDSKGRSCGCKIKTQQNKVSNFDKNSEAASSKGQFSDKDSMCNSISNNNRSNIEENVADLHSISMQNVDTHRDRVQVNENYMICSHGPKLRDTQDIKEELPKDKEKIDTEVEVLPFKKDKRVKEGRVYQIEISKRQPLQNQCKTVEHEEQSMQSVPHFSLQNISQVTASRPEVHFEGEGVVGCEVESMR